MIWSFGQMAFSLQNDNVELAVTESGGHLAPVTFTLDGGRQIQPFAIAPWWNENTGEAPLLQVLRGDFFCMPFGANNDLYEGERYLPHGETASCPWRHVETVSKDNKSTLHLQLDVSARQGRVDKIIEIRQGHSAVYQRHVISGLRGPMPLGHHATLKFESQGLISTSPRSFGKVNPTTFENPAKGGYSFLKPDAEFTDLTQVPCVDGSVSDLSIYPNREGFEDLAMVFSQSDLRFAWTAVVFPQEQYLWIAFKDPRVLVGTIFWCSNGGRHYSPWRGRHRAIMGLEEATTYFAEGLAASARANSLSERGIPTCITLSPEQPSTINYVMAVAAIPKGFNRVASVREYNGGVEIVAENGERVSTQIDLAFLAERHNEPPIGKAVERN
jgi:hypothetical protein